MRHSILRLVVIALVVQSTAIAALSANAGTIAGARPQDNPGNVFFQRTWERTDQPVADGAVARTWMWGPQAFTGIVTEQYDESPNGRRTVQYFDKSRMEITSDPDIDPASVWYVTNGLLVVELITGKMQVGDNRFVPAAPAEVNVAGDADDPTGPTYASFAGLLDASPLADAAPVTQRLSRDGTITNDPSLADQGVIGLYHVEEAGINHEIASPFWAFMNSSGVVFQDDDYVNDDPLISPYYATGYPITEAYWARVKVAGDYRDVLVQCFERRCLTYTPGNSPGFETEAGNVGQHYYAWRYAKSEGQIEINEVLYWPEDGDDAWIELYNASDAPIDLTGWVVTNADKTRSAALPPWVMPKSTYLQVVFGDGANPSSFRDGTVWHTGSSTTFFTIAADGVALFHAGDPVGSPPRASPRATDASTIVDYVGWSYGEAAPEGLAVDSAVDAGIWSPGDFVATRPRIGPARVHLVQQGESIGRDKNATDTDGAGDWSALGGPDAFWSNPGEPNVSAGPFEPSATQTPNVSGTKDWTVMAFFDGRDPTLYRDFVAEINRMEDSGSGSNVNIVVQLDWADQGELAGGRWYVNDDNDRGVVTSPMESLESDRHNLDPGDPAALSEFIEWATDAYPARHYALVLGGNGRGWKGLFQVGPEDDFLTMSELEDGMSALGEAFDVVDFEAPLMGSVEVGYQIADRADTMVASEEIVWGAYPWGTVLDDLAGDSDIDGGEFADSLAQVEADQYDEWGLGGYTIASIDLDGLTNELMPAIDDFASDLLDDIENYRDHGDPDDNLQVRLKDSAQETTEDYADTNFKDLGDLAEHIRGLPVSAALPADALVDALDAGGPVVRWAASGDDHPDSHGLSIYFPHDEDIQDPTSKSPGPGGVRSAAPFDDPLFDPATSDTHLYALDSDILVPELANEDFPMRDDPGFRFPADSTWDEFLHRYYKPVADACIVFAGNCVSQLDAPLGATLELSGEGSSDGDGPQQLSSDLPDDPSTTDLRYYWDFNSDSDHPGSAPNYREDVLYGNCDDEDCDRDAVDEPNDDVDAVGSTVEFNCDQAGEFTVRLMVWDDQNELARVGHEDERNNDGRHWLHFNVDDDTVVVRCFDDALMVSEPATVMPDDEFTYTITLPGSPRLQEPTDGFIHDALPDDIQLLDDGNITCSAGECGYDPASRTVFWFGQLAEGDRVTLQFDAELVESDDYPSQVTNCADVNDGSDDGRVCATTTVENPVGIGPPSTIDPVRF